ncbi:MAG: hypothetical protein V1717_02815, partial [Candidatus Micrarchaeota archaeon]
MKLVRFVTRKYVLLEHWLIAESLLEKNASIPGFYYSAAVDVSKAGLVEICVPNEDYERNLAFVKKQSADELQHFLENGLKAMQALEELPIGLEKKIGGLKDDEIIAEL